MNEKKRIFFTPGEIYGITKTPIGLVYKSVSQGVEHRYTNKGLEVNLKDFRRYKEEHSITNEESKYSYDYLEQQLRQSYDAGIKLIQIHNIEFDLSKPLSVSDLTSILWKAKLYHSQAAAVILAIGFAYLNQTNKTDK